MRRDAQDRVRAAITAVMDEYGVAYEDVRRRSRRAIRFTVAGKTRTLTYGGGDPRAHRNARSQARRILQELGVSPPSSLGADTPQPNQGGSMQDEPRRRDDGGARTGQAASVENDTKSDQHAEAPHTNKRPEPPRYTDLGYVVYNPLKYQAKLKGVAARRFTIASSRFIAVRLDRELIVGEGTMLVVPLDIPDVVWDMPEHEFRACFAIEHPAADDEPMMAVRPVGNDVRDQPVPVVEDKVASEPEPRRPDVEPQPKTPAPSAGAPRERPRGVSPQMGRVLLAMYHLHQRGMREIPGSAIQNLLSPVDARQVSGMLTGAMKQRYVTRGSQLETGRGSHYRLSEDGKRMARGLGTWPYDHRGLAVPPWLRETLARRG